MSELVDKAGNPQYLPKQLAAAFSVPEVDVDVMILPADGLLDEWLLDRNPIDDDRVSVLAQPNFSGGDISWELDA